MQMTCFGSEALLGFVVVVLLCGCRRGISSQSLHSLVDPFTMVGRRRMSVPLGGPTAATGSSGFRVGAAMFMLLSLIGMNLPAANAFSIGGAAFPKQQQQQQQQPSIFRQSSRLFQSTTTTTETPAPSSSSSSSTRTPPPSEADVIVIGSGLAGLSCAALLSYCHGKRVVVLESHDIPGGAAHSWTRRGFHFESGPSLYSGLSTPTSPNPLKGIFQMLDNPDLEPTWLTYDRWGTVLPDGSKFAAKIGPEEFETVLLEQGGPQAVEEFAILMDRMKPLSNAAQALTSLALREDAGAILTLLKYPVALWDTLRYGAALQQPFSTIVQELQLKNPFVKNWLDMLCFLLQGLPAAGTMNAVIAYMLADWYRPGVTLDFPKGGSGAIVNALVRAVQQAPSSSASLSSSDSCQPTGGVFCNCHVDQILVSDNGQEAIGVQLATGQQIMAQQAVVSNADPYVTWNLLKPSKARLPDAMVKYMEEWINTDTTTGGVDDLKSFIHLHAGINATGLPTTPSADFPAQWAVIRDWEAGVEAPRNIVLCSMPSLIDYNETTSSSCLAPPGCHVLHAYVPATEPYADWAGLDRSSPEYLARKEEAADFLWTAIEEYIPHARERAMPGTVQIGTPLTHERFLRRTRGTYGPRLVVGGDHDSSSLPGHGTPLSHLYMVGDFTFPGIGVPATAASGAIAAHSLVPVWDHLKLLDKLKLP